MKKTRLLAFLLTACLATTCFLSGTVAKYSSTASETAQPTVAKWSFNVENANIATANTFTFTPFAANAIKDSNGTSEETDVKSGSIAPGTSGSFEINLENTSEVTARYAVAFAVEGPENYNPLKFALSNDANTQWVNADQISTLNIAASDETKLGFGEANNKTASVTIYWKWDFEQDANADASTKAANDAKDVAFIDAVNTTPVKVTATVTAEQVD